MSLRIEVSFSQEYAYVFPTTKLVVKFNAPDQNTTV